MCEAGIIAETLRVRHKSRRLWCDAEPIRGGLPARGTASASVARYNPSVIRRAATSLKGPDDRREQPRARPPAGGGASPTTPSRRSTRVATWFCDRFDGPPASTTSFTTSGRARILIANSATSSTADVVADAVAVAEDRRHTLLANPFREELIDPDLHERRRPQHHVGDAAPANRVLDVPLDPEDIDTARPATRPCKRRR